MNKFLDSHFLLHNETARHLYVEYAEKMPVIDYHCHLPPVQIMEDHRFDNLTQVWLYGDHYKWRAMRTNGVDESYCTGDKSDFEKFIEWAKAVPYTLRNPLYHWTHLELQRYFDVHELLNEHSARRIYEECSEKLRTEDYSVRNLLRKMNVALVCTTDDPLDHLGEHQQIKGAGFEIPILPTFRPDKAMNVDDPAAFNAYVDKLESLSDQSVHSFTDYLSALKSRHEMDAAFRITVSMRCMRMIIRKPAAGGYF